MNYQQIVYNLDPIVDVPQWEGFGTQGNIAMPDSYPKPLRSRDWKTPRLAETWKPIEVVGRVRKFNDYPCVGLTHPALSQRAVDALRNMLETNGEILPLKAPLGQYYFYNITTVADVLDPYYSDVNWVEGDSIPFGEIASTIDRYEFYSEKLSPLSIFQIPEQPGRAYVTETFASRVRAAGLQGFHMTRLWPLPPGVDWWRQAQRERKEMARRGLPAGKTAKGQSVVIRLFLNKKSVVESATRPCGAPQEPSKTAIVPGTLDAAGTAQELVRVNQIMDDLDNLLVDVNSSEPIVGSLEGHDFGVPGECRLFLSCPDAEALVKKLSPWLKKLDWAGKVQVVKRYGSYGDASAREEIATV